MLAALIAAAAVPGAPTEPDRWSAGAAVERVTPLDAARGLGGALARLAQAQASKPDAAPGEGAEGVPPLKWLRYSSERFRTLMRMLAARSSRVEAKRAAEEAKLAAEAKAAEEARRAAEAKAAEEAKRAAEAAKRVAEAKAAEEAKRVAEAKAAEEAKRVAEAKAAEGAKRAAEAKAVEEAKRVAEVKAAEEAKRAAEAKAAEEAKRAAEAKPAEQAKRVAEEPKKTVEAAKPAPAKRLAPCRNAGVKVAGGAGWYVVQVGDSLWSIARTHYGYGRAYGRIHAANRRTIANPGRIYPCQRIYIPRGRLGEAPLQDLRVALAPFVRRRSIDGAVPWLGE